jgi:hypothetical protein
MSDIAEAMPLGKPSAITPCSRALLIKQRTMLLHSIRAHLAELGISIGVGTSQVVRVVRELAEGERSDLPELARFVLEALAKLVCDLAQRLQAIEKKLISWHYKNDLSNRLETISGVGFVTASALSSIVPIRRLSSQADILPPGSAWCRDRTPPEARLGLAASASKEINISGNYWCSAQPLFYATFVATEVVAQDGSVVC